VERMVEGMESSREGPIAFVLDALIDSWVCRGVDVVVRLGLKCC
jgi:hypothetical protein